MKIYYPILFTFILFAFGCNTGKVVNAPVTEFRNLDTLVVSAPRTVETKKEYKLEKYNPSATRTHDLLHTKLDLKFNWEKEQVIGKANLRMKPYFHATDKLILDAKGFEINKVTMSNSSSPLKFEYDGAKLEINLDRVYTRQEEFGVFIDYLATPRADGGSAAINSDKGLFFINPRNEEGGKMQQIWTQGETENNSRWFPTFDKPNERTTQEMYLTVQDKFKTLSNGLLVSSNKNVDGTRTDYWKMDEPHAPYLFMVAIGEFAKVNDSWRGIPVDYYVEPEYEADAKNIFPHTPEMLEFFSNKLGVDFPWKKYSQIVVKDFVSGAMENTTASIFGDFIQKHSDELEENDDVNQMIVAHEMFHQWFGDFVTCESWSNLTLNEGFANYSEYLWAEEHEGKDKAEAHRLNEMNTYLQSSRNGIHDLIHFGYDDKEQMFDAHSYNKGGLVLHMLRNYLGDDAFFSSLQKYLTDNAFTAVEADELRMAFEDTTGEDLNWFFNQWYFEKGQPELSIDYDYNAETGKAIVTVEQTQDPEKMPAIFQLPVLIDIWMNPTEKITKNVFVNERKQTFEFAVTAEPKLINFDAQKMLLAEKAEAKSIANYVFQYENCKEYLDRYEALEALQYESSAEVQGMYKKAMSDSYPGFRAKAIGYITDLEPAFYEKIQKLISEDPSSQVRSAALAKLAESGDAKFADLIVNSLKNEKSTRVKGEALIALQKLDPTAALKYAESFRSSENPTLIKAAGEVFAASGDTKYLEFFEKNLSKQEGFDAIEFTETYSVLAAAGTIETMLLTADKFFKISMSDKDSAWKKFGTTKAINDFHVDMVTRSLESESETDAAKFEVADAKLVDMINQIKAFETNGQLQMFYGNFPTKIEKKP